MNNYKKLAVLGALSVLVLGYNNCGQVKFSNAPVGNSAATAGAPVCGLTGTQSSVGLYASSINYIPLVEQLPDPNGNQFEVQNALNMGDTPAQALALYNGTNGLLSDTSSNIIMNTVESFFNGNPYVNSFNNPLYLEDINYPSIYFSNGFTPQGGTALQSNGQVLDQFFAFRLTSSFTPIWPAGQYQIATITDDGSILTMTGSNNFSLTVKNDGAHTMRMGCTDTVITVGSTPQTYNLQFDYFQGPPVVIGLIALYRPVPADGALEPLCDEIDGTANSANTKNTGDGYFFKVSATQSAQPQAAYLQLKAKLNQTTQDSGGWTEIEGANYTLPAGVTNPCP